MLRKTDVFPLIQDEIAKDIRTLGAMFVPIILGSDKTTVSVGTGQNDYWPIYLSIGNIRNNVRRAHRDGLVLLGFLPIAKSGSCFSLLDPAVLIHIHHYSGQTSRRQRCFPELPPPAFTHRHFGDAEIPTLSIHYPRSQPLSRRPFPPHYLWSRAIYWRLSGTVHALMHCPRLVSQVRHN